jgi:two-component system, NarL family, sensor kinase
MNSFRRIIILCVVFVLLRPAITIAQVDIFSGFEQRKEKAIAELQKTTGQDTARVNALIRVFRTANFLKQQKQVEQYCHEALAISRRIDYTMGLARSYLFFGNYHRGSADIPKAHTYYDSVLLVSDNATDTSLLEVRATTQRWKGMIYYEQENYYAALHHFFEALRYYESSPGMVTLYLYTTISIVYLRLNNTEQATFYANKNITLAEKGFGNMLKAQAYMNLIDILIERRELSKASYYLDKIMPNMPDSVEMLVNYGYYQKRGQISFFQQQYDSSFSYYRQAAKYAEMKGHTLNRASALYYLSYTALKLGKLEIAKKYAEENLALVQKINAKGGKINALLNLSDYYHRTGNDSKAYELLEQAAILKDSLLSETTIKQTNTLAAIFEADKREKEIFKLKSEKELQSVAVKQKSTLNSVFIGTILSLLFFGYMAFRNFKNGQKIANQQQEIQKQKIIELEKDKQLLTIDAMLKGQEEERSRIAKDLHDGLGGMLSGVKLSFINMKENMVMSEESLTGFERSVSMLDKTIGELRKVAHNLMPEALVRFGLDEALKDFCHTIQVSSGITVIYQQFGEQRDLTSQADVTIYRIVQELVNNALKYANAKQVIVQVTKNHSKTSITVEDDGKGFDLKILGQNKGAGFENIRYRVNYFKGSIDIYSGQGDGTSVNIELMV